MANKNVNINQDLKFGELVYNKKQLKHLLFEIFPITVYTARIPLSMKKVSTVIGAELIHVAWKLVIHCKERLAMRSR